MNVHVLYVPELKSSRKTFFTTHARKTYFSASVGATKYVFQNTATKYAFVVKSIIRN